MTVSLPQLPKNWKWSDINWYPAIGGRRYKVEAEYILAPGVEAHAEVTILGSDSVDIIQEKFNRVLSKVVEYANKVPLREEQDLEIKKYVDAVDFASRLVMAMRRES
jgi:uncharacterized protein YlzI (FlbEa/FlbD family)